ncbi:MAG: glucose-1-phosphate adenylyltransferase [Candidatus Competibacteraceae bacterium]|nr:glucose-1-phosphate adenylyltransferase [Candidatus Competibacteraceae bacterium]
MDTDKDPRFVSRITRNTLALILAGGKGSRLHELVNWRAKPAVYFGGKFRIIDFPLSNCVNSGIRRIGVLTQYKAHSLIRHLVNGWSHFQGELGEFVEILPASQRTGEEWYAGTADAVYQNLDIISNRQPDHVLILSGDHIYKMDYGFMMAYHVQKNSVMTVSCLEVPVEEAAGAFGVIEVDENYRVTGFQEKPAQPTEIPGRPGLCLASMGNYVFNTEFLYQALSEDADDAQSKHDFGYNIIPKAIAKGQRVYAYPFRDPQSGQQAYWRDVGTIDAFWEANLELVGVDPEFNLYDHSWPILTYQAQLPPAKFVFNEEGRRGMALDSIVSGGCIISGARLERSLLFSDCRIHSYAEINNSVLLPGVDVGRQARINNAVIDRGVKIPEGMIIGEDPEQDRRRGFRVTDKGVVLVAPEMLGQSLHYAR